MFAEIMFSTGVRRELSGPLAIILKYYGAVIAACIIYATTITVTDLYGMTTLFLAAVYVLVFLTVEPTARADHRFPPFYDWILAALSAASAVYFFTTYDELVRRIALMDDLSFLDLIFGTIVLVLTLEATRRTTGLGLMLIVLMFLSYNLFGDLLTGPLRHGKITFNHLIDINVFTSDGIFGVPLRVAATYAFLFVIFGTLLERCGGGEFFNGVGAIVAGRTTGGSAKIAIVSSGLYGTISGSPTADVVTTGSITIPMMIRSGYSKKLAGAIEVVASTGGSIMPPVMGSVAFIMSEYTGISYQKIAIAAIIPALLYYLSVFVQVHFRSKRMGLGAIDRSQIPTPAVLLDQGWVFIIPLAVIVAALILGYSPNMVAVFGAIAVLVVATVRRSIPLRLDVLVETLAESTMRIVAVTAACAAAGLVIGGLSMTGLAAKFSTLILELGGGTLLPTLIVAAAITTLLGMGMPTPGAYILATVLIGPAMIKLGMSVMAANMFILYYAVLSATTPPVAVAAYAASAIARENPLHIAAAATKLSMAAFLVPFTFAYGEELLLRGDVIAIIFAVVKAITAVFIFAVAAEGFWNQPMSMISRLIIGAGAVLMLSPLGFYSAAGVAMVLAGVALCRLLPAPADPVAKTNDRSA
jgi:TRAP transporter 4TM/12TM fusion protein